MTLETLLTLLETEVSRVSWVQATNGAASSRYPKQGARVSGVSRSARPPLPDTSDTSPKKQGYQPEALLHKGCTLDTCDTPKKIEAESNARNRRAVIRFRLKADQGGGVAVGECSADELMGDLRQRYCLRLGAYEVVR
ncbi:hypothetical protein [Methylococcus mesophilus]|uniref:hypothetical protein n=1 Tax=Methylococcus mesophilus TaxID=2993564 RepID=UPI00224AA171|nr:hypothetical protein [Methylococcus mesophilus]UZR27872.1 hypothetical protein OOT43_14245 [Methylococcus mesophilus]